MMRRGGGDGDYLRIMDKYLVPLGLNAATIRVWS